ncbi:response regulator, partial [Myxococcota bacterium]|nr:response regulator [Myxococcota bacterium]
MSKKALIIDSDIELIEQLQDAAVRLGLDAETTTNGNEGVDLASLDQPAVVLLGIMDTKGAGYGLCSKLRRRAPTVPVLMLIDADEEDSERLDRHRALKTSADAYLVRPFTMSALADAIDRLVPGVVIAPTDPEEVIGETAVVPNDSLLGGSLFNDEELRELEKEAEQAFSSIVVDPVPTAGSREFEVDDLDLIGDDVGNELPTGGGDAHVEDGTQVLDLNALELGRASGPERGHAEAPEPFELDNPRIAAPVPDPLEDDFGDMLDDDPAPTPPPVSPAPTPGPPIARTPSKRATGCTPSPSATTATGRCGRSSRSTTTSSPRQ